ncbi:MAG: hypothetical protein GF383_05800 [Candidatus Lokiarchaeota archaeon]|nr:hypothetical protein [Candidatus Lokiarchaeota archaeon]MBD3339445.1 hypothetical protein [Candidatus Lokiarchaeota archaeon]
MGKWKKINNSEIFQGKLKKKSYFEGWYFKLVDETERNIIAIIPGIALDKKKNTSHSFIQFFDGISGKANYFKYAIEDFKAEETFFKIKIANSEFSENSIVLDINQFDQKITGELRLRNLIPWPKKFLNPGIMGFFTYLPFLQTYHGLVSMNHDISGYLRIGDKKITYDKGSKGYTEKDWGSSFPSSWIWMQSNHFSEYQMSFMLSIATIPMMGNKFTGFLAAIWRKGKFYNFATYTRARIRLIKIREKSAHIIIEDKKFRLIVNAYQDKATDLKAPSMGIMLGHCIESMTSRISLKLQDRTTNKIIFNDVGKNAGLEIMDNDELEI